MIRRDFLWGSAVVGVAAASATQHIGAQEQATGMPKLTPPEKPAELNLCLQWGAIPGAEMNQKLDFLEANGFAAVELPSGPWLFDNVEPMKKAMGGRKLFIATACGPSDFSYAEAEKRDAEVAKFLPQLEVLGTLKSVGLIICPARNKPGLPFPELREDFVNNTGRKLAEHAAKHGTSIVLEPLQRGETKFLRQVADGAAIAKDIGPGCTVMGDFWHMSKEETSFMGAFLSAGKLLSHVHIASLKERKIPGVDGPADNYVEGFKGLKLIGYRGAVSLEGGFPKNSDKTQLILNMVKLLREQWAMA
jgi:sugar phosphate isomerase/epimerase